MTAEKEAFVGIDAAKLRNAVAIADAGRDGEIRYVGEVDAAPESMRRLIVKLAAKYDRLHFCYEAGPTGYGLHRQITELGHSCIVVAPSLIPRKASDRVKTNRRDATALARLLRAGELTAVWVPDPAHEAMRNLIRSRTAAVETICMHMQQVGAFLLRHSRIFRRKNWGARYRRWLQQQSFEHPVDQIVLQEYVEASGSPRSGLPASNARSQNSCPAGALAPLLTRSRRCAASTWSRGELRGRDRRHSTVRQPAPTHGLSWLGSRGTLDRRDDPARLHHQDGERADPPIAGRERLDLPLFRHAWEPRNRKSSTSSHPRFGKSPGKHSHASTRGFEHSRREEKRPPWRAPP